MKTYNAQITSVRKARFKFHESVSLGSQKCPLSVLTGVCIKRANVRENIWLQSFSSGQKNLSIIKAGVRIKQVSVKGGSTVFQRNQQNKTKKNMK